MDIDGKDLSSEQLAETLKTQSQRFATITFVIGGSHGLCQEVKNRANLRWSMGKITLPHRLCRVVLTEQIYRACCINNNVPYHKWFFGSQPMLFCKPKRLLLPYSFGLNFPQNRKNIVFFNLFFANFDIFGWFSPLQQAAIAQLCIAMCVYAVNNTYYPPEF